MAPALERWASMLFNECETISRGDDQIYLAGVDDAHFYRATTLKTAAQRIPRDAFSILLSHTPEVYDHAASAGFDLMLSGHTHGGPALPPWWNSDSSGSRALPRTMGAGPWHTPAWSVTLR